MTHTPCPVDSDSVTVGAGIPGPALDRLIDATRPTAVDVVEAMLAAADVNAWAAELAAVDALDALPDCASAFAAADISSAVAHLRAARWLIARADLTVTANGGGC